MSRDLTKSQRFAPGQDPFDRRLDFDPTALSPPGPSVAAVLQRPVGERTDLREV
jgi:hypothetical protein